MLLDNIVRTISKKLSYFKFFKTALNSTAVSSGDLRPAMNKIQPIVIQSGQVIFLNYFLKLFSESFIHFPGYLTGDLISYLTGHLRGKLSEFTSRLYEDEHVI